MSYDRGGWGNSHSNNRWNDDKTSGGYNNWWGGNNNQWSSTAWRTTYAKQDDDDEAPWGGGAASSRYTTQNKDEGRGADEHPWGGLPTYSRNISTEQPAKTPPTTNIESTREVQERNRQKITFLNCQKNPRNVIFHVFFSPKPFFLLEFSILLF